VVVIGRRVGFLVGASVVCTSVGNLLGWSVVARTRADGL